tara:strand:- start:784 stop:1035 length:252 start_codon:yes stop_codon:yes gene_type:complete
MKFRFTPEVIVVIVLTLFLLPWGIYANRPDVEENLYINIAKFLSNQPLVWGLWTLAIGYCSIHHPSVAIMLSLVLTAVKMAEQ